MDRRRSRGGRPRLLAATIGDTGHSAHASYTMARLAPCITFAACAGLAIAAGRVVFEEPLPGSTLGIAIRLLAFTLVVTAAALTPAPARLAEAAEA